jgi:hypothetical protein
MQATTMFDPEEAQNLEDVSVLLQAIVWISVAFGANKPFSLRWKNNSQ